MSRQLFLDYHQLPFMPHSHNIFHASQNSSPLTDLPHSCPPIPSLFTSIRDGEDSYETHHHTLDLDQKVSQQLLATDNKSHNNASPSAPEPFGRLPPLSPIFPTF